MSLGFEILDAEGLAGWQDGLRELEADISYPIEGGADSFRIDHGSSYASFFTGMGKARFMVVTEGSRVVGSLAAVWKEAELGGRTYTGLYFADLKIAPSHRRQGIPASMFWKALRAWPLRREYQGWDFVFYAAMRGSSGDVSRSFQGSHLGRITRPAAELKVYFLPGEQLSALGSGGPPPEKRQGAKLSLGHQEGLRRNFGRKDFVLGSTGEPWKLVHVSPLESCGPETGDRLAEAGRLIAGEDPGALGCFAVDRRSEGLCSWLAEQGVVTDTWCTVYSISFFAPGIRGLPWLQLSTSEI